MCSSFLVVLYELPFKTSWSWPRGAPDTNAMACQKLFPLDEVLWQNVLFVVSCLFDFCTFEDFYLSSPSPFYESTTNIRLQIGRINSTRYHVSTFSPPSDLVHPLLSSKSDYHFNLAL